MPNTLSGDRGYQILFQQFKTNLGLSNFGLRTSSPAGNRISICNNGYW